jgi:transcriptional regulator
MGRPQNPGGSAAGLRALDLLILARLSRGRMHGFGVAEYLRTVSDEILHIEEGSLYPALHRLEAQGLITSEWGLSENNRRARFYDLTPKGRKRVQADVSNWRRFVDVINRVVDPAVS